MGNKDNVEKKITRVDGQLYEIMTIKDDTGRAVQSFEIPLKVELKLQDV
jgi:hypothetical protein